MRSAGSAGHESKVATLDVKRQGDRQTVYVETGFSACLILLADPDVLPVVVGAMGRRWLAEAIDRVEELAGGVVGLEEPLLDAQVRDGSGHVAAVQGGEHD